MNFVILWWWYYLAISYGDKAIRCRSCGAFVTDSDNYYKTHDTSRSVSSEMEETLGKKLYSFENPNGIEFSLATFDEVDADVSLSGSNQHSFFPGYSWRIAYCSRCKAQLGFYYLHADVLQCQQQPNHDKLLQDDKLSLASENVESIIETALKDKCLVYPSGWWTYKYCYHDQVTQYHEEKEGERTSEWSMGSFKEEYIDDSVDENGNTISLLRHLHTGGQHCDENGHLRSTETRFVCCSKEADKTLHIAGITEPSLCSYLMTICVPQLCAGYNSIDLPSIPNVSADKQARCRAAFTSHQIPAEFFALIWPNVVMEGTVDIAWVKELKTSTSLS